jgi:hypothetical protein
MTGVGDILPPEFFSLSTPEMRRIFSRYVYSTIWDISIRLNSEVESDQAAEHLHYVCQFAAMLQDFVDGEPSESNRAMMVHEIENHEAILDEIYMEVPDR